MASFYTKSVFSFSFKWWNLKGNDHLSFMTWFTSWSGSLLSLWWFSMSVGIILFSTYIFVLHFSLYFFKTIFSGKNPLKNAEKQGEYNQYKFGWTWIVFENSLYLSFFSINWIPGKMALLNHSRDKMKMSVILCNSTKVNWQI